MKIPSSAEQKALIDELLATTHYDQVSDVKSGWRIVKFGDIAENVAVRVEPAEAQTDVYVGLEHLDPETLHLRKWGRPSDVTGQKLAFNRGDVIFGRRRAYQRKLAVAEFDGICSAHAMVIRAKPEMILPEFLPFFLQSDMFMERAIEISVGSLSPTINWKTLRVQEFPLPPIEEQKRIAEILWAADEVVEAWVESRMRAEAAFRAVRSKLLDQLSRSEKSVPLAGAGRWISGGTPSRSRSDYWGGDFPWVSPKDMKVDIVSDAEEKLTEKALNGRVVTIQPGSILIVVRGMILAHTFPVALTGREVSFNQDIKGLIPDSSFLPRFVFHWFQDNSSRILQVVEGSSHGTKRLATEILYRMHIPRPSKEKQKDAVRILDSLHSRLDEIAEHISASRSVCRAMRNEMIGDRDV